MAAHQKFSQFSITRFDGIDNAMVLNKSPLWSRATGTELGAIKAHKVVKVIAEQIH